MNNLQPFSRPIKARDIKKQIVNDLSEVDCAFCEGCSLFNNCLFSEGFFDFRYSNSDPWLDYQDHLDYEAYRLGLSRESLEEDFFDMELSMLESIIMLNPENSRLSFEQIQAMALKEYRLCRD